MGKAIIFRNLVEANDLDQFLPTLARFGPLWPDLGQSLRKLSQFWGVFFDYKPRNMAGDRDKFGPMPADSEPTSTKFGWLSTYLGWHWRVSARPGPYLARCRPTGALSAHR